MALDPRLTSLLRSMRTRAIHDPQAVLEANPVRLCRVMAEWAQTEHPDPEQAFIHAVLEAAADMPDPGKTRAFINYFKHKPKSYMTSPAGKTAIMLELWMGQKQPNLYRQMVETSTEGTPGFFITFLGPLDPGMWRTMLEQVGTIGEFKVLLEAGQRGDHQFASDYTIVEVTNPNPEAAAAALRAALPPSP